MYKNKNLNHIGLDSKKSKEVAENLNNLLSDFQLFYMNLRGFHWNIKGEKFFELHLKFEELYNDAQLKIDEIAERVLTLGFTPIHTYSDYIKKSQIKEASDISDGKIALKSIIETLTSIIISEREILNMANDANDEGTNALMSDYIREQEKLMWMLKSYLN
ncbi:MAG: Dps family protein [Candidatus Kapaibacteriota bacterium]|jgi:starvation-inducible DNA-binding protein